MSGSGPRSSTLAVPYTQNSELALPNLDCIILFTSMGKAGGTDPFHLNAKMISANSSHVIIEVSTSGNTHFTKLEGYAIIYNNKTGKPNKIFLTD